MAFDLVGKAVKKLRLPTVDYHSAQPYVIPAQQGDKNSRYLQVTLYDDNGDINVSTFRYWSGKLNAKLPDGTTEYSDVEINAEKKCIICELSASMLKFIGTVECDIILKKNSYKDTISSKKFYIDVHESQFSNDAIKSSINGGSDIDMLLTKAEHIAGLVGVAQNVIDIKNDIVEIDKNIPILNNDIDKRLYILEDTLLKVKVEESDKCGIDFLSPHDVTVYSAINKVGASRTAKIQSFSRVNLIPLNTSGVIKKDISGITFVREEDSDKITVYGEVLANSLAYFSLGKIPLKKGVSYRVHSIDCVDNGLMIQHNPRQYTMKLIDGNGAQKYIHPGFPIVHTPSQDEEVTIQLLVYGYKFYGSEGEVDRDYGAYYGHSNNIVYDPYVVEVGSISYPSLSTEVIDEYVLPSELSVFNDGYIDFDLKKHFSSDGVTETDLSSYLTSYDAYNFIKTEPGGSIRVLNEYGNLLDVPIKITYMTRKI